MTAGRGRRAGRTAAALPALALKASGLRPAALTAAALLLALGGGALAGCGGGSGDDGRAATPPSGSTATQPPTRTLPGSPPLHRYRPPAIPLDRGSGPPIGGTARLVYTTSTFEQLPQDFVPGGIPVGTRAGDCEVIAFTPELQAQLQAAIKQQTPRGEVEPLTGLDVLLADCGDDGRWAMVRWIQHRGGRAGDTTWVDELRDDGGGIWTGTARGVQPGCRMPRAAAAAWQLDVTVCPPPRPRPRATPPTPAPPAPGTPRDPRRRGGPLQGLPPGSSRA